MKYILNETPVRTSNNFRINDLTLDLNIEEKELSKVYIKGIEVKTIIKNDFNSRINLQHNKYNFIGLNIFKDSNIEINSNLETNYLVDQIDINLKENTTSNFIIKYSGEGYHNSKICINTNKNSTANITILNLLSKDSLSFISLEGSIDENSNLNINFIDLGGKVRVNNYYSILERNSINNFNNIYIGKKEDRIDMNYYMINKGENSNSNIEISGSLFDDSHKSFKGTIDFVKGSINSIGYENENCLLFSDKTISKSLPMLLCHEETVNGTHSVSTGKVDEDKLFYLETRGITKEKARKLLMMASFNKILNRLDNKDEILKYIDEYIK